MEKKEKKDKKVSAKEPEVSKKEQNVSAIDGKISEIRAKLDDINKLIKPYQLAYVHVLNDCVPLEKNAHYMSKEVQDRLTENIKQDGFLSQLPFCMKRKEDGKYLFLSGNHRLKSAIKAGLEYILVLYVDDISKDRQIGYALSHNSLVGKDDLQMLKEIYNEIESIEAREFSGLNGLKFIEVDKIPTASINDGDIELTEMKFLFVESRKHDVEGVLRELEKHDLTEVSALVYGSFEEYIKVATQVKKVYDIKSNTVAFSKMVEICKEHIAKKLEEIEEANKGKE